MERNNMKGPTVIEGHQGECSNPTVEIKIKTLDSQVYTLKVNKQVPVPALKEQIATVTGVLSEQQRLICRGKVLKDDQLLSAYHVEDGHTLHLVVRQPFQHSSSTAETATTTNRVGQVSHGVFLGTVNIPDQVDGGVPDLNRVFSSLLGTVGAGNFVPVSSLMENRATFISPAFQSPGQGSSGQGQEGSTHVSSRLDLNQPLRFADIQMESGDAVFRIPAASILRPLQHSAAVPDSLSTMLQYIDRMRNEFTFEGTSNQSRISSSTGSSETEVSGNRSGSASGVLISPAALAEVLQSTQQLLTQQTGQLLNQLAAQLECDARITDPEARNEIQSTAIRNGIMLQNLGALLLELGRSVMTLRMGQSPAESVVNAGPAVFISNSGPNPLMVQPLPFLPGSSFGSIPTAVSHQRRPADGTFPAGISAMVDVNDDQSDQASTQSSTPGRSHVRNIPSLFGENSSVRVVPLRTVMAVVPSALSGRVSEASGGGLGVFYPFLARLQHLNSSQSNQARSRNDTEAVHLESQDARAFSNDEDQMQVPSSMQSGRQHDGNQEASRLSSIRSSTPRVPELGQERANPRSYIIEVGAHNVSVVNGDGSNNTLSGETSSSTQLYDAVGRFLNNMLSGGEASIGRRVTFDFMSDLQNASRSNSSRRTTEQAGETSIAATGLLGQTLHGISFNTENGRDSVVESDISLGFSGMHQQRTPADPEGLGSIFGVEISGFPEPEANSSGHDVEMEQHTLNDQDTLNDQHNSANETAMEIERSQDEDLRIFGQNIQVDENSPPNKRQKTE